MDPENEEWRIKNKEPTIHYSFWLRMTGFCLLVASKWAWFWMCRIYHEYNRIEWIHNGLSENLQQNASAISIFHVTRAKKFNNCFSKLLNDDKQCEMKKKLLEFFLKRKISESNLPNHHEITAPYFDERAILNFFFTRW